MSKTEKTKIKLPMVPMPLVLVEIQKIGDTPQSI